MKLSALHLVLLCFAVAGCATQDSLARWKAKADAIPIGSSQQKVESTLPPLLMTPIMQNGPMIQWWVDDDVYVTALYAKPSGGLSHPIKLERKPKQEIGIESQP